MRLRSWPSVNHWCCWSTFWCNTQHTKYNKFSSTEPTRKAVESLLNGIDSAITFNYNNIKWNTYVKLFTTLMSSLVSKIDSTKLSGLPTGYDKASYEFWYRGLTTINTSTLTQLQIYTTTHTLLENNSTPYMLLSTEDKRRRMESGQAQITIHNDRPYGYITTTGIGDILHSG